MNLNDEIQQVLAGYALPNDVIETFATAMGRLEENNVAPGLSAGERAPDFELPNPHGKPVRLSERLAGGPVVLSFFRGDWCPICGLQLRALERALPEIREARASLIAVTPQSLEHALSLQEKAELTFDVLSDAGQKVIRDYRVQFHDAARTQGSLPGLLQLGLGRAKRRRELEPAGSGDLHHRRRRDHPKDSRDCRLHAPNGAGGCD